MRLKQYVWIEWVHYDQSCRTKDFLWRTYAYIKKTFIDYATETICLYKMGALKVN